MINNLSKEIEKLKYDKRLTDWHLAQGILTQEELTKHLAQIPDSAANVDIFQLGNEEAMNIGEEDDLDLGTEEM